jgi:nitrogen fixation protein NifU and related proteins
MYSEKVIERFKSPKFSGEMKDADAVGEEGNMKCGDMMRIYLKIKDGLIADIRFQTYGCVAAIVSSDMLCELAKGKTLKQAESITSKDILASIGEMPSIKHHCSILGAKALHNAIENYKKQSKHS